MGKTLLALAAMAVLLGCQAGRRADLESSVESYVRAISRKDTRMAMAYVSPQYQVGYQKNLHLLEGVRFSHIEVQTIFPDEKVENAVASVFVEFFSDTGSEIRTARRNFRWAYEPKIKTWVLAETNPLGTN